MNLKMAGVMIILGVLAFSVNGNFFKRPLIQVSEAPLVEERPVEVQWDPPSVNAHTEALIDLRRKEIQKAQELQESNPNAYFGDPSQLIVQ